MKLALAIAQVIAVTPLMLKHGSGEDATLVPASSITFRGEVNPQLLDELREGLSDRFFEKVGEKAPRVPSIPELDGAIGWKTEYEGATLNLDLKELEDLDFDDEEIVINGVNAKGVTFEPLSSGMVDFKINAIVETDDAELRGKLNALLRHRVDGQRPRQASGHAGLGADGRDADGHRARSGVGQAVRAGLQLNPEYQPYSL